ncbi:hypothetical protein V6Z12_D11G299100 [Gossypium hirsutum]
MTGVKAAIDKLTQSILNPHILLFLISIKGTVGSGRRTLLWPIYNAKDIKQRFQCHAWVHVPQEYHEIDILTDIFEQVTSVKLKERLTVELLRKRLHNFLAQKRFLIVLDDVPTPDVWERLNHVFPNLSNGSRVIITTRNAYLAYHINPETVVLQLRPLTDDESWELFLNKVKNMQGDINLKEKILQICHGLPLRIVLLGGLLSRKDNYVEWTSVINHPIPKLEKKKKDLAPALGCCLLYLGLFPKSYEIPLRRLYQLWLAEGFVTATDQVKTPPEKLVEEYFEELKCRNMIEVTKHKLDGRPKACRVPNTIYNDLFLDTEKVGFFHFSNSSGICGSPWFNIRRLSEDSDISSHSKHLETRVRRLRSYISFYGKRRDAPTYGVNELLSKVVDKGFGMLVVLDLEGVYKPVLSDTLGKLPYLKYLGLRRTLLDDVPQSVGDLHHLETLDIKHTFITKLPSTIWKAKKLQHLYMSDIDVDLSSLKPFSSGSLNNLKILCGLVIKNASPWITLMEKLQSLKLRLIDKFNKPLDLIVEDLQKWHQMGLSQLYLLGKLPKQIGFPENLEILTLSMTHLLEDPMKKLGELKRLKVLRLYAQSFLGTKMTCDPPGFPQLRVLKLWMLYKLKCWTVKERAMPKLREVEIRSCKNLKKPDGLENLAALEELALTNMKEDFIADVERSMDSKVTIMKNFYFSPGWEQ